MIKNKVANQFNSLFSLIANSLVDTLPLSNGCYGIDFVKRLYSKQGVLPNSFSFAKVSVNQITKMLEELQVSKSTGLDDIPARFLRDAADIIAPTVTFIVNLSLETGIFPSDMKIAKIIPLFKKGNRCDPGNYRPISILSVASNFFERIVYNQMNEYLTKSSLIYMFQSGFRKSHSTDNSLLYLTDFIRRQIDEGKMCGMVLLDLQKAFDTVNHSILLDKLSVMGFSSKVITWFNSYLSERVQRVEIDGVLSEETLVKNGVPQGSVLGPLLFLLYINDMQAVCDCNFFYMLMILLY